MPHVEITEPFWTLMQVTESSLSGLESAPIFSSIPFFSHVKTKGSNWREDKN